MQNLGLNGWLSLEAVGVIMSAVACRMQLPSLDAAQLRSLDATQNCRIACDPAAMAAAWDLTAGLEHVSDVEL